MGLTGNLDIDYAKLNIDKLFQNMYVVPAYQREYVWDEKEVEQMMTDLITAFENDPKKFYFMGMIVVYSDGTTKYELIDGQQRITTFFLLVCAFIHYYLENNQTPSHMQGKLNHSSMGEDGESINGYSLELQYSKSTDILDNIYNNKIDTEYVESLEDGSDKRLYNAYSTIRKIINNNFSDHGSLNFKELKDFVVFVWSRVQMIQIETRDLADALKIFETINQRGVGLNSLDLLKNMIFMQISRDDFNRLNTAWKSMIDSLLKVEKKPLRFLRYFITSNYDITDPKTGLIKGILAEDMIYDWVSHNDSQCHYTDYPFEFMDTISNNVAKYVEFIKPTNNAPGDEYLLNIPRIAGSSYRSHMVLLLAAKNMTVSTLAKFKQLVELIIYYSTINGIKGNETEKLFAAWAVQIRNIHDTDELKSFALGTIKPQINKWMIEKNYRQRFMELNMDSVQKYRIKYILARIGKYIDEYRKNGKNYADINDYCAKNIEIEHIMPQECLDLSDYEMINKEEFSQYLNKLGNLTLLEKTFNSSCKNKSFNQKQQFYVGSSFYMSTSIFSKTGTGINNAATRMDQKLTSWLTWNKDSINERQDMLFKIAGEIWDIDTIVSNW